MKRICLLFFAFLLTAALPGIAQEGCGGRGSGTMRICSNGAGCNMQSISTPPAGFDVEWQGYRGSCCGTQVTFYVPTGSYCNVASMGAKQKAAMALLLSHGTKVTVRDCTGHMAIYTSPIALSARNDAPQIDFSLPDRNLVKTLNRAE